MNDSLPALTDTAVAVAVTMANSLSACCSLLASSPISPLLALPNSTAYATSQAGYWSSLESSLLPSCIVQPIAASDVALTLSLLAPAPECRIAIHGAGHAPAAGFSNVQGGVTIDMSGLNAVGANSSSARGAVSVGAGATWLDVYTYLDARNLSAAGGRNGGVGVAGLALGGGISYFAPRVGWACDGVVGFEIALPNGTLVTASAGSSPELFRALKGGGPNFGVVTRLDLATFAQGALSVTSLTHDVENLGAVFAAFSKLAGAPNYDPYASVVTGLLFAADTAAWTASSTAVYTAPGPVTSPTAFDGLRNASVNVTQKSEKLSVLANEAATPALNWLFWTGTYGVSAALMDAIFDTLNATLPTFDVPGGGLTWSIAFEPLPTAITRWGNLKGGNVLGTEPSDGNAFVLLLSALWPTTANGSTNAALQQFADQVGAQIDAVAHSMGLLHRFRYANYAGPSQNALESYGDNNVALLQQVSRAVDPQGIFQKRVGGFKIPS